MAAKRKSKAERMKNLKGLIASINKKEGENVINFASDPEMASQLKIEFIPTKSPALNAAFGGYPKGRMTIVSGLEDVGKTMRILEDIGYNMQNDSEFIASLIESEDSFSDEMFDLFGIDRNRFIVYKVDPDTGAETAMDYCIALAEQGVDLIMINSLKCLTPSKEFKDSVGDANIGLQARLNSKFCRKVIPVISKSGTALVCTQHKSTEIGKLYGDPMQLAGGHAIRYNSMLILDLNKVSIQKGDFYFDRKDECMRVRCKVKKNHCCPTKNPYVTVDYTVIIGKGTDTKGEIIEAAFNMGIAHKQGAWIRLYPEGAVPEKGNEMVLDNGDVCKFNGMAAYVEYLENNSELFEYIQDKVLSYGGANNMVQSLSEEEISLLKEQNENDDAIDLNLLEDVLDGDE
jgi:recombination protein RecA